MNQSEENRLFEYSIEQAIRYFAGQQYKGAIAHLDNAKYAAERLESFKRNKEVNDWAEKLLEQIRKEEINRENVRRNFF